MKKKHLIPICIELVGISAIGTGIGLEIAVGGSAYLIMITTGSCLVAAGGIIWGKFMRGGS
jgi:hydroxymethylglutaryl-CoA reductase